MSNLQLNNQAASELPVDSCHSEAGVTLVEYVIAIALIAVLMLGAVPNTERAVESRIDDGAKIWTVWNIAI